MTNLLTTTAAFIAVVATTTAILTGISTAISAPKTSSGSLSTSTVTKNVSSNGSYHVELEFGSSSCSGTPWRMIVYTDCDNEEFNDACEAGLTYAESGKPEDEVPYSYTQTKCVTSPTDFAEEEFGDQAYVRFDYYSDDECTEGGDTIFIAVDGKCHQFVWLNYGKLVATSLRATANSNGSITYSYDPYGYENNMDCSDTGNVISSLVTQEQISTKQCVKQYVSYAIVSTNVDFNNVNSGNSDVSDNSDTSDSSYGRKPSVNSSVGVVLVMIAVSIFM